MKAFKEYLFLVTLVLIGSFFAIVHLTRNLLAEWTHASLQLDRSSNRQDFGPSLAPSGSPNYLRDPDELCSADPAFGHHTSGS